MALPSCKTLSKPGSRGVCEAPRRMRGSADGHPLDQRTTCRVPVSMQVFRIIAILVAGRVQVLLAPGHDASLRALWAAARAPIAADQVAAIRSAPKEEARERTSGSDDRASSDVREGTSHGEASGTVRAVRSADRARRRASRAK